MARSYPAPKGTGVALAALAILIGGAVLMGKKASASEVARGRFNKDGQFYYYEVSGPVNSLDHFAVFVSEPFDEAPPFVRDTALPMAPSYYVDGPRVEALAAGVAYIERVADYMME